MGPFRSCWNGTSALQPEENTSKGTSFMCVLSIKVPIRKKSGNLFNDPRIYIYIYMVQSVCCHHFKLSILCMRFIHFGFCLFGNKQESIGHCL